jgi:hypothetical protein
MENLIVWLFVLILPVTILFLVAVSRRRQARPRQDFERLESADPLRPPMTVDERFPRHAGGRPKDPFKRAG